MTADIVNLRQVRKAKRRTDDATDAANNRARFGRTRGEREKQTMEAERATRLLDGARIAHDSSPATLRSAEDPRSPGPDDAG